MKGFEGSFDIIIDEILRSYNHKAEGHLEFDEMFSLVKEIMPEVDLKFNATDEQINEVVRSLDLDGDGTYDRSEVRNFMRLMLQYGWEEGKKRALGTVKTDKSKPKPKSKPQKTIETSIFPPIKLNVKSPTNTARSSVSAVPVDQSFESKLKLKSERKNEIEMIEELP